MSKKSKISTRSRAASVKVRGRSGPSRPRNSIALPSFGRFVLPLIFTGVLIALLVFLVASGYQTATASAFFGLKSIDIRGIDRTSKEEISRIISSSVEKQGVWNADLADIRLKIEKFPFVKSAAVSMTLPAGIRVNIIERVPAAVVHLNSGNFLVDVEGNLLIPVKSSEKDFPFILQGWDESKTEKAIPDNLGRLKVYKKMLDEWKQFDLMGRVKEVNLANPRQPVAVVEDSGHAIAVTLAKDSFGKGLKTAIEALTGKGARVKSVDSGGISPIIQYIDF